MFRVWAPDGVGFEMDAPDLELLFSVVLQRKKEKGVSNQSTSSERKLDDSRSLGVCVKKGNRRKFKDRGRRGRNEFRSQLNFEKGGAVSFMDSCTCQKAI
ncbi:hypothetical protein NPIL_634731 [Nephila pilipes]|uniref:Uncharacterized protein n=1 Tax=Nephila pilipes TaxID=299642 RepID=A0A8X6MPD0_NEPPI|nr:hypothetical protein NPIL_634731 [Nephila pilipes]